MNLETDSTDRLLTEGAAAQMLGCSPALLRKMRLHGGGPAYCKIGRLVRYPRAEVQAFINKQKVN